MPQLIIHEEDLFSSFWFEFSASTSPYSAMNLCSCSGIHCWMILVAWALNPLNSSNFLPSQLLSQAQTSSNLLSHSSKSMWKVPSSLITRFTCSCTCGYIPQHIELSLHLPFHS